MSTTATRPLGGQATLVASWQALAEQSAGARIARTQSTIAAVFPAWVPLNNAILLEQPGSLTAATAAIELKALYASAGVKSWALWLPALVTSFGASDKVPDVPGLRRDTTTLVMELQLSHTSPDRGGVVRTSVAAAGRAGDEPVPVADLPQPDSDAVM